MSDPSQPSTEDSTDQSKYSKFKKIDGAEYESVNDFLKRRTHLTAREWAIASLAGDFRTGTGVKMTALGENLPDMVPFMTDPYSPQAVNSAHTDVEDKARRGLATFLYVAISGALSEETLDDVVFEAVEVAKFLVETQGDTIDVETEIRAEKTVTEALRQVRERSQEVRAELEREQPDAADGGSLQSQDDCNGREVDAETDRRGQADE